MNPNKFDLSRNIPESIKRLIRQRCGFGCVICGKFPFHYDHFEPEFKDAKKHNADGITLLCPSCHQEKTNGDIRTEKIKECNANPFCFKNQGGKYLLKDLEAPLQIKLGQISLKSSKGKIFQLDGKDLISITESAKDEPPYLNLKFSNDIDSILEIVNNEIVASSKNWDFEKKGKKIIIRKNKKEIFLEFEFIPPSQIQFKKINFISSGLVIKTIDGKGLYVRNKKTVILLKSGSIQCNSIDMDSNTGRIKFEQDVLITSRDEGFFGEITMGINDPKKSIRKALYKIEPEYFKDYFYC